MLVLVNIEKIKNLRLKSGLTIHGLSIKAGLGKNAISQIENNQAGKCSLVRIKAIADALNVDSKELIIKEEQKWTK